MKQTVKRMGLMAVVAAGCFVLSDMSRGADTGGKHSPLSQIVALLNGIQQGIADLKNELQCLQVTNAVPPSFRLSSGPFGLPANAASVDWEVLNNSSSAQVVKVTVFRIGIGIGPKTPVPPGPLSVAIPMAEATHNANFVGPGLPFEPGFNYEVVVETTNANVLPMAVVWQDYGNTQIAGTLIPSGCWVKLQ